MYQSLDPHHFLWVGIRKKLKAIMEPALMFSYERDPRPHYVHLLA